MQHRNWKVNKSRNYVQYLDDETQGLKKKKKVPHLLKPIIQNRYVITTSTGWPVFLPHHLLIAFFVILSVFAVTSKC